MENTINQMEDALKFTRQPSPWSDDIKASDDFFTPLFQNYSEKLGEFNQMNKAAFCELARFLEVDEVDPEIVEKLDEIAKLEPSSTSVDTP